MRRDRKWKRTSKPNHPWNPPKLSGPPLGQVARQNVGGQETPQTGLTETSVAAHTHPGQKPQVVDPPTMGTMELYYKFGGDWGITTMHSSKRGTG